MKVLILGSGVIGVSTAYYLVAVGAGVTSPPRADPGVRLFRTGLLSKVGRDWHSELGRPI